MPNKFKAIYMSQIWPSNAYYVYPNIVGGVVSLVEYPPEQSVDDKIDSFANLPMGWDYGRGGPIAEPIRDKAKNWHSILGLFGLEYMNAFPGINAITLAGGAGNHRIEIIITSRGGAFSFGFAHDVGKKQQFYKTNLSEAQMQSAFENALVSMNASGATWNASASSTLGNTILMASALSAKHSRNSTVPSPSSGQNVQGQFAHTFTGSTESGEKLPVTQRYFGGLTPTVYQPRVA